MSREGIALQSYFECQSYPCIQSRDYKLILKLCIPRQSLHSPLFKRKTTVHHIKFYVLPTWLRWAPTLCTSRMAGSSMSTTMQMMLKGEINDFHFKCKCKWCWRMISEILKSNVNFPFQLCSWGCVRWHRSFPWGLSDFMKTNIKSCTIDNLIIRLLDTTGTMEELDTPPLLDRFNQMQLWEKINRMPKDIFMENTYLQSHTLLSDTHVKQYKISFTELDY